jgi:hypothetical protein
LIAKPILISAVRALPGDGIAGHPPYIFFHTILADTETTPAPPAEAEFSAAAMASMLLFFAAFSPVCGLCCRIFHGSWIIPKKKIITKTPRLN